VLDRGPLIALADLPNIRRYILRISNRMGVKFSQHLRRHDIKSENKLIQNFAHILKANRVHYEFFPRTTGGTRIVSFVNSSLEIRLLLILHTMSLISRFKNLMIYCSRVPPVFSLFILKNKRMLMRSPAVCPFLSICVSR
jgi:hypothetical protein